MTDEHFDRVVRSYFTALTGEDMSGHVAGRGAGEASRAMVTEAMNQS